MRELEDPERKVVIRKSGIIVHPVVISCPDRRRLCKSPQLHRLGILPFGNAKSKTAVAKDGIVACKDTNYPIVKRLPRRAAFHTQKTGWVYFTIRKEALPASVCTCSR